MVDVLLLCQIALEWAYQKSRGQKVTRHESKYNKNNNENDENKASTEGQKVIN